MTHSEGKHLYKVPKQGENSKVPAGRWTLDYTTAVPASRIIIYIDLMLTVGVFVSERCVEENEHSQVWESHQESRWSGKPHELAWRASEEAFYLST